MKLVIYGYIWCVSQFRGIPSKCITPERYLRLKKGSYEKVVQTVFVRGVAKLPVVSVTTLLIQRPTFPRKFPDSHESTRATPTWFPTHSPPSISCLHGSSCAALPQAFASGAGPLQLGGTIAYITFRLYRHVSCDSERSSGDGVLRPYKPTFAFNRKSKLVRKT